MTEIIKEPMVDILNEGGAWLSDMLMDTLGSTLRIETLMADKGGILTTSVVEDMYQYIYSLAATLLILKFLFKGFSIYILWRDGDADSSPQSMLIGTLQAIVTVVVFPYLYNIMADVTSEFCQQLMSFLALDSDILPGVGVLEIALLGLLELIIRLIYLVLFCVLYIKLLQRGFELLILRLGVPFACMGLVDSDSGIFKSYMQVFYKTMFTSVIQLVLLRLSMPMMQMAHPIIGIAIISTAFATPMIMQQFMIPANRGGLTQKIYTGSMAIRAVSLLRGR